MSYKSTHSDTLCALHGVSIRFHRLRVQACKTALPPTHASSGARSTPRVSSMGQKHRGFLWRLHCISVIGYIIGHWRVTQPPAPVTFPVRAVVLKVPTLSSQLVPLAARPHSRVLSKSPRLRKPSCGAQGSCVTFMSLEYYNFRN